MKPALEKFTTVELIREIENRMANYRREKTPEWWRPAFDAVIAVFQISERELLVKSRVKTSSRARGVIIYLLCCHGGHSLMEIGRLFEMDHTNVYYWVGRIPEICARETAFAEKVEQVEREFVQKGSLPRPAALRERVLSERGLTPREAAKHARNAK